MLVLANSPSFLIQGVCCFYFFFFFMKYQLKKEQSKI